MKCLGYVICHKNYAKWLRTKGLIIELRDILDWDSGIGKWLLFTK